MRGTLNCISFREDGKCIHRGAPSKMFGRKPDCILWNNHDPRIRECALKHSLKKPPVPSKPKEL